MIVYKYDEQTRKFTGTHKCQKCPETGQWLYPKFNTTEKPLDIPTEINYKSNFFIDNKWKIKDNFVGIKTWNKKTGQVKINEEFKLDKEYTELVKTSEFHKWETDKWVVDEKLKKEIETELKKEKIKSEYIEKRSNGHFKSKILKQEIDGRDTDFLNISAICTLPEELRPDFYRTYENKNVSCKKSDFELILQEIIFYQLGLFNKKIKDIENIKSKSLKGKQTWIQ